MRPARRAHAPSTVTGAGSGSLAWPRAAADWAPAAVPVLLIYAAHVLAGANRSILALILSALTATILLVLLAIPSTGARIGRIRGLPFLAAAFALVVLAALASMTPWAPGGPHPLWTYTTALGAVTVDRSRTLVEVFKLLGLAAMFLIGAMLGTSENAARRTRLLVLWLGAAFALLAFARPGNLDFPGRLMAGFGSPNSAGAVMASLAILSLPLLRRRPGADPARGRWARVEALIAGAAPGVMLLLLFLVALVLTASRGAMVSAALAVFAYLTLRLLIGRLNLKMAALWVGALAVVGVGVVLAEGGVAVRRFGEISADANGRASIFAVHWDAFQRSPLMGYGLGSFDAVNKLMLRLPNYHVLQDVRAAHNVYLQWLEEAGILGAAPMFACIGAILVLTALGLRVKRSSRPWICALLAVDVVFLAHGVSDYALQVPSIAAFWALLLGLQLGMVSTAGRGAHH